MVFTAAAALPPLRRWCTLPPLPRAENLPRRLGRAATRNAGPPEATRALVGDDLAHARRTSRKALAVAAPTAAVDLHRRRSVIGPPMTTGRWSSTSTAGDETTGIRLAPRRVHRAVSAVPGRGAARRRACPLAEGSRAASAGFAAVGPGRRPPPIRSPRGRSSRKRRPPASRAREAATKPAAPAPGRLEFANRARPPKRLGAPSGRMARRCSAPGAVRAWGARPPAEHGYYDEAHMANDVRRASPGATPARAALTPGTAVSSKRAPAAQPRTFREHGATQPPSSTSPMSPPPSASTPRRSASSRASWDPGGGGLRRTLAGRPGGQSSRSPEPRRPSPEIGRRRGPAGPPCRLLEVLDRGRTDRHVRPRLQRSAVEGASRPAPSSCTSRSSKPLGGQTVRSRLRARPERDGWVEIGDPGSRTA